MDDFEYGIKATSVKDYINENKKAKDIYVWLWKNFLSRNGKRIAAKVFILMFAINLLGTLSSYYGLRMIFDGVSMKLEQILLRGYIAFMVIMIVVRVQNYWKQVLREYFFDDFSGMLNEGVSRMFFGKSLGIHISEDNYLSEASVKKGFDRGFDLMYIVMFEAAELLLMLALSLIMLFFIHWLPGFLMLILTSIHLLWSGVLNFKVMVDGYFVEKAWRVLHRYRVERWKNVERVKNNAKEEEEINAMKQLYNNATTLDLALWLWNIRWSFLRGTTATAIFLIALWYAGKLGIQGFFSSGWLYPIISLSQQILDNLWQVGDKERKIHYNLHSVGILKKALDLPVGITFSDNPVVLDRNSKIDVEFRNVSYKFGEDPYLPAVLTDISFVIKSYEKVALIGTSGAGKTTLMRLLLRYMDPTGGSILVGNHDLREVKQSSWLNLVGYIPQHAQIFSGTIKYNILYGISEDDRARITDEYIWEQMRRFQVDFGERLTRGLETKVGHNGIKLSGGQNQRLMVLAAAIKNPKFMIIDEATSSLDSTTEKKVQAGLERVLNQNCGALIVAHRLSTVRRICDKFVMIEANNGSGGKIVGTGKSFEELYEICPQFRKLADDQEIRIESRV